MLVAHGNFVFDKPVLESAFGRSGIRLPSWLVFMDTMPILRRVYPRLNAYTLTALHAHAVGGAIQQQHTAAADVKALAAILHSAFPSMHALPYVYYPAYYVPLQTIKGIGQANEWQLVASGVESVTQLEVAFVQVYNLDVARMAAILVNEHSFNPSAALVAARDLWVRSITRPMDGRTVSRATKREPKRGTQHIESYGSPSTGGSGTGWTAPKSRSQGRRPSTAPHPCPLPDRC